jgi:hypothetical protein
MDRRHSADGVAVEGAIAQLGCLPPPPFPRLLLEWNHMRGPQIRAKRANVSRLWVLGAQVRSVGPWVGTLARNGAGHPVLPQAGSAPPTRAVLLGMSRRLRASL